MAHYVLKRPDGTAIKSDTYKSRPPAPELKRYDGDAAPDKLPARVDLRPFMTTIEDQQKTSSCVANAVAGAYEYLVKAHTNEPYDVSRMFIYWNGRAIEGRQKQDEGMLISEAVQVLQECGCCAEKTWPFDESKVNQKPSDKAYSEAAQFKVEDVHVVPLDLEMWRSALAEGYPIIFGISLFKSFDRQKKPGLVPAPTPAEASRESHGGHAMLCVGYSDADKVFIVRNSWGTSWGDAGYCYIPYAYVMNPDHNAGDSWIIRQADQLPGGSQHSWFDDLVSILEELDGEIANMPDDDYTNLLDACGDVQFETRLAALFLTAAGADGEVSSDEATEIGDYMSKVMSALGVQGDAGDIIEEASTIVDEKLVTDTIGIFGDHLSSEALASMLNHLQECVGADGTATEEAEFVDALIQTWQVETE